VLELGGGRTRAEEGIDYAVGHFDFVEPGQKVDSGEALCVVPANSDDEVRRAGERMRKAIYPERSANCRSAGGLRVD